MNKYEGMFLVKSNLDEKTANAVFEQIREVITKNKGKIVSSRIWAERRKLFFIIKKKQEATYYLVNFSLSADLIDKIKEAYRLNEDILRVLITRDEY